MQVCNQVREVLLVQLITEARHHAPAMYDALDYVFIRCGQAAGQVFFFVEIFKSRPFVASGRIGRMAAKAVNLINVPATRLLSVKAQFGIRHECLVFAAAGQQTGCKNHQKKNGRCLPQVAIMSCAQRFENPRGSTPFSPCRLR